MHTSISFRNVAIQEEMNEERIQTWLVEQISRLTGLMPYQIEGAEPFASYGIDSVAAAGLSGDLANWLGKKLPPTITWDYPSVKLLASHLASKFAEQWLVAV